MLHWHVLMKRSKKIKYHYDADLGVFVNENEISVNWFLSQVLKKENLQITKVSDEEIQTFLLLLEQSNFRMPDGQHSLYWLKNKIRIREEGAKSKTGESFYDLYERYKFIREQIDFILVGSNIQEINIEEAPKLKKINRTPNNMNAYFEPLKEDEE